MNRVVNKHDVVTQKELFENKKKQYKLTTCDLVKQSYFDKLSFKLYKITNIFILFSLFMDTTLIIIDILVQYLV